MSLSEIAHMTDLMEQGYGEGNLENDPRERMRLVRHRAVLALTGHVSREELVLRRGRHVYAREHRTSLRELEERIPLEVDQVADAHHTLECCVAALDLLNERAHPQRISLILHITEMADEVRAHLNQRRDLPSHGSLLLQLSYTELVR